MPIDEIQSSKQTYDQIPSDQTQFNPVRRYGPGTLRFHYEGLRPYADKATSKFGGDPNRVLEDANLRQLTNTLANAYGHANDNRLKIAGDIIRGGEPLILELRSILATAEHSYADAAKDLEVDLPSRICSEPDPDNELLKDLMNKIDPVMQEGERPIDTLDRIIAGFVQTVAPATEETTDEDQGKRKGKK